MIKALYDFEQFLFRPLIQSARVISLSLPGDTVDHGRFIVSR